MISLEELMLNWAIVPIVTESAEVMTIRVQGLFFIRMISGMIFCHVAITAIISHSIDLARVGIHE
jgi:hypothetical protein